MLDREKAAREGVELEDEESEEELEEELEDDEEGWGDKEFVSDMSGDEDGLSDLEDAFVSVSQKTYWFSHVQRLWQSSADEDEDEESSEENESGEEDIETSKSKIALGKRKAAPHKPPKKKPEKKARRMYLIAYLFHSFIYSSCQVVRGWKLNTKKRWRVYLLLKRLLQAGDINQSRA